MANTRPMFDVMKSYGADGDALLVVERVMERLYGETAISGDERRDLANAIFAALRKFVEIKP